VKKLLLTLIPILVMISYASCSKDHDAPTFSKYSVVKKPTNVVATYSGTEKVFNVSWDITDTTDVVDYYVAVSDSLNFGKVKILQTVGGTEKSYKVSAKYIPSSVTSLVQYFSVQAIYSNEDLHFLIGPRSDSVDSALYVK